jgi:hypothetical protein
MQSLLIDEALRIRQMRWLEGFERSTVQGVPELLNPLNPEPD